MNFLGCLRSNAKIIPNKDAPNTKPEGKDSLLEQVESHELEQSKANLLEEPHQSVFFHSGQRPERNISLFQSSSDQQDKPKMVENHPQSKAEMSVRQSQPLNNKELQDLQNEALNHLMLNIIAPHNQNTNLESMVELISVVIDMSAEQDNSNVEKNYDSQFSIKTQFPSCWREDVSANKDLYHNFIKGAYIDLNKFAVMIKQDVSRLLGVKFSSFGAKAIQGMLLLLKEIKAKILHVGYPSEDQKHLLTVVDTLIKKCEDLLRYGKVKSKWIENVKLTLNDSTYILKLARDNGSLEENNYIKFPASFFESRSNKIFLAEENTQFEANKKKIEFCKGPNDKLDVKKLAVQLRFESRHNIGICNLSDVNFHIMPTKEMLNIWNHRWNKLDLSKNKIEKLESGIFYEKLRFSNSTYSIDLSDNNIKKIPKDVFDKVKFLRDIYLYGNPIEEIEEGAFGNGLSSVYLPDHIDDSMIISGLGEELKNIRKYPELEKFIKIKRESYHKNPRVKTISISVEQVQLFVEFLKSDINAKYYDDLAKYCCYFIQDLGTEKRASDEISILLKCVGRGLGLTDNQVETRLKEKLKEAEFKVQ